MDRPPKRLTRRVIEAVDLSTARLTAAACAELRVQGIDQVIVGLRYINAANLHVEPYSIENLHVAASEMPVAPQAYAYYWLGGNVRNRALWSVEACLQEPRCSALWHDWEDNGNAEPGVPNAAILPPAEVVELMHIAHDAVDGAIEEIEYTAGWWYPFATGNYRGFSGRPLADAHYSRPKGFDLAKPYGGWDTCQIHQYQGTVTVAGLTVDRCIALV